MLTKKKFSSTKGCSGVIKVQAEGEDGVEDIQHRVLGIIESEALRKTAFVEGKKAG